MSRVLIAGAIALATIPPAAADTWIDAKEHPPATRDVSGSYDGVGLRGMAYARAKVWLLLDAPIVYCDLAVAFGTASVPVYSGVDQRKALEAVSLISATLQLSIKDTNLRLDCDAGALGDVFLGRGKPYELKTAAERARYISFNVPGSPSWDRFLYRLEGHGEKKYLDAASARRAYKRYANRTGKLPLEGFPPYAPKEANAYRVDLALSTAGIRRLMFTTTLADRRADQARYEAQQQRREQQRREQLASIRKARQPPASVGGTRVVESDDPFWGLPASVATPAEHAEQQRLASQIVTLVKQAADAAKELADDLRRRRSRSSLGDPEKLLAELCGRAQGAYQACLSQRCGREPETYFNLFEVSCLGQGAQRAECERKKAESKRRAREKEAESDRKQRLWQSCVAGATTSCAAVGTPDIGACRKGGLQPP